MRTLCACLSAGLILAAPSLHAETYKVTLYQRSEVAGQVLQPGDYKVDVEAGNACFRRGRVVVDTAVTAEQAAEVARVTSIRFGTGGEMYQIKEITPKGTRLRLVFR